MKNRTRETCTSGTVRDEAGNILIYSASNSLIATRTIARSFIAVRGNWSEGAIHALARILFALTSPPPRRPRMRESDISQMQRYVWSRGQGGSTVR